MVEYLVVEDLVVFTRDLDAGPVRDVGLLESAAARPRTSIFGEDAYPSLPEKAAALVHSVCCNHALVDGNKRLALVSVAAFLRLNGYRIVMTQDEAFDLIMAVADGSLQVGETAAALAPALREI